MSLKDIRIGFDLDDPIQNEAYAFLKKIDHKRGAFISFLVAEFLLNNYKDDASKMTKEEAKFFTAYILGEYAKENDLSSHSTSNKINAMLNVLSRTTSAGFVNLLKNPTTADDNELSLLTSRLTLEDKESDNNARTTLNNDPTTEISSEPISHSMPFQDVTKNLAPTAIKDNLIHPNEVETEDSFEDLEDIEDDSQINEAAFNAMMDVF